MDSDMDEVPTCFICLQTYKHQPGVAEEPLKLLCGHTMCRSCLHDLRSHKEEPTCPFDRSVIAKHGEVPDVQIIRQLIAESCKHRSLIPARPRVEDVFEGCDWMFNSAAESVVVVKENQEDHQCFKHCALCCWCSDNRVNDHDDILTIYYTDGVGIQQIMANRGLFYCQACKLTEPCPRFRFRRNKRMELADSQAAEHDIIQREIRSNLHQQQQQQQQQQQHQQQQQRREAVMNRQDATQVTPPRHQESEREDLQSNICGCIVC